MTRFQQILAGLLALQIGLAVLVFWPRANVGAAGERLLSNTSVDDVVSVSIESGDGQLLALERAGDGWVMADSGYPALSANVVDLLDKLSMVESGRLVTQTSSSHRQLQVAEDNFQRYVKLTLADGTTRALIFGSAPTPQTIHVRVPNQDETWITSSLALRDIDPAARNWVETVYYTLDQGTITGLVLENRNGIFELVKLGSGEAATWSFTDLESGETFNQTGLNTLLGRVATVRFDSPLGQTEQPSYRMNNPAAIVTVRTESGTQQLVIGEAAEGEDVVVKWSDSPYYVAVSAFNVEIFTTADRSNFATAPAEQ